MKKFTMFLAVMLCLGVSMKAQTYVGDLKEIDEIIPGYFTSSGHPYVVSHVYSYVEDEFYDYCWNIYQSDFITHLTDIHSTDIDNQGFDDIVFIDLDNYSEEQELSFTQTLFNDDEFFEYFTEEYIITDTHYDTSYYYDEWYDYENDVWHDTVYMYVDIWSEGYTAAFHVKSTNGSTVWTCNFEENQVSRLDCILKFDNNFYLLISTRDKYDENYYNNWVTHIYLIKKGQGIVKVESPLPLSVFPTLLNRDQQITVELGDGNNAREVTVVNNMGQVVKTVPVAEGQRTVSFPARDLRGLNVLHTRTSKGQGSCKIIVK